MLYEMIIKINKIKITKVCRFYATFYIPEAIGKGIPNRENQIIENFNKSHIY